jgi:hypothetical protein
MVLNRGVDSMTMSGQSCGVAVGDLPDEDMNRVYYYAIFPNMAAQPAPRLRHVPHHLAEGTGRSRIFCSWLFHPATLSDATFKPEDGCRVLGHDQQAGLAHLRAEPARRR